MKLLKWILAGLKRAFFPPAHPSMFVPIPLPPPLPLTPPPEAVKAEQPPPPTPPRSREFPAQPQPSEFPAPDVNGVSQLAPGGRFEGRELEGESRASPASGRTSAGVGLVMTPSDLVTNGGFMFAPGVGLGEISDWAAKVTSSPTTVEPPLALTPDEAVVYRRLLAGMSHDTRADLFAKGGAPLVRETLVAAAKKVLAAKT